MREILFRGKTLDGEWVQGDLSQHTTGKKFIRCKNKNALCSYEVIPETIGQYTGLTDENGTKIFEGDILADNPDSKISNIFECVWCEDLVGFMLDDGLDLCGTNEWLERHNDTKVLLEVIGNIHDNPELLKGGADNG